MTLRANHRLVLYALSFPLLAVGTLPAQDFEAPQQTEYKGPAVLSRGSSSSFRSPFETMKLRPFANISGTWSSNLAVAEDGLGSGLNDRGATGTVGVYGIQRWRRKELSIGYTGGYTRYATNTAFNGPAQFLTLSFGWQLSPRFILQLQETAGTSTRATQFAFQSTLYTNSFQNFIPNDEAFDNRIYFANSGAMLVFRKSARLSYSIGADHFTQRRKSILPSVGGYRARADVSYRMSRNVSIGADYEYTNFEFTRGAGDSQFHGVGFNYSQRFGRNWELVTLLGAYRLQNVGIISRPVDPEVALIVGRTSVPEVEELQTYAPRVHVSLMRNFRRGSIGGQVISDTNPGNGLLLTARGLSVQSVFSYAPSTRIRYHGIVGWERKTGVQRQQIGAIRGYTSSGGLSYSLGGNMFLNSNFMMNNQWFGDIPRKWLQVSAGLSYSPGEMPLSMW